MDVRLNQMRALRPTVLAIEGGVVELPSNPQTPKERSLENLLQVLGSLFTPLRTPGIEEQCLARAIDANDFEVRLQAIERGRL